MPLIKSTVVQTKPQSVVPRGGQAEARCGVTYPDRARPRGVVHFIGGAVVGAAPDLTYSYFIDRLARDGYTVIQTPYPFTFRHKDLAVDLKRSFDACVVELTSSGRGSLVPVDVPVHGVGHSNGALMHLLIGSLGPANVTSNVLISYNNKEVSDAIPIPNFIERTRPLLQQGRQNGMALSPDEVRLRLQSALQQMPLASERFSAASLGPVVSQLSSCLEEIEEGTVDFDPTPTESRKLIASGYAVRDSLLVRFANDGIDETPDMSEILRSSRLPSQRIVHEKVLPGTHITPCIGDISDGVDITRFSPFDAVRMASRAFLLRETAALADVTLEWLDRFD